MGKAKVGDIELSYQLHGTGEPLLLIEGLGYATWMWYRQLPELSRHYQVIAFDNRGVGDSDKPDLPYTIEMMADDAAGLLKNLGIAKAHVLGVSMGGFIAQAFAARYPEMTGSLILVCTSFGGPGAIPMTQDTLNAMLELRGETPEEKLMAAMSPAFSPDFIVNNNDQVKQIIQWRLAKSTPRYAWQHQLNAVAKADLAEKAREIAVPTLILTGEEDRVIPAENSKLLQERINSSTLTTIPNTGHLLFIEKYREFNDLVLNFLQAHSFK
jgi:pimeloyl-ACP methyl ester carboxylesterase